MGGTNTYENPKASEIPTDEMDVTTETASGVENKFFTSPDEPAINSSDIKEIAEHLDKIPPVSMYDLIGTMVDGTPNDADLGKKVRDLFHTLRHT